MKKYFLLIGLFIISILSIAAIPAKWIGFSVNHNTECADESFSNDDRDIKKEFQVKAGGKLNLELNSGASITAEGWDKELVSVEVQFGGRDADNVEFEFRQNGNDVTVESNYKEKRRNNSANIKVLVMMPQKYNVEFTTTGGSVSFKKVDGEFEGTTMGGSIDLSNVKGKAEMKTMGGSISVKSCDLDGKVETMGGSIDIDDLIGNLDLSTMGGSIKQNNVRERNDSSGKEVTISTMGGSIEVDQALNGARVKTMGGPITVNKAAKFVEAETMGGGIEIKEIDGRVKATTMGGDIEVKMVGDPNQGDRNVFLKSMGGDIYLTVPANLSMDVDIEIGYTKDHDVKIESDFDLKQEREVVKKDSDRNRKKYLLGTGIINGGKNKIKIQTNGGDVYLKKS